MSEQTSCMVEDCPCMERDAILAEIEATSELLDITRDPWPIAASLLSFANLILLAVLLLR